MTALRKIYYIFILYLLSSLTFPSLAQKTDSLTFRLYSRYSFYTLEESAEMILHVPQSYINNKISALFKVDTYDTLIKWEAVPGKRIVRIPFKPFINNGFHKITAEIKVSGSITRFIRRN